MPHGAACTHYSVWKSLCFARETATIIDVIKRHFLELVMAREGTKGKAETLKREWLCMFQSRKHYAVQVWLYQSARCVGRNFCGYLSLRFFLNRKNSQNIVPANNSNSKVPWSGSSHMHACTRAHTLTHTRTILNYFRSTTHHYIVHHTIFSA